jgi:hypothetical protein
MKLVADLIADVKDRASIPADDERITDTIILKVLNQVLDEHIYPDLLKISEEFGVVKKLVNLAAADGTAAFPGQVIPLPRRAYGRILREVKYYDGSDNLYNIPYVSLQDEDRFLKGISYGAIPIGFYFISDAIKLIGPNVNLLNVGKMVFHYVIEPNTLVNKTTEYAPISDMDYNSTEQKVRFIVNTVGSSFPTLYPEMNTYCINTATKLFDLYRKSSGALLAADLELERDSDGGYTYFKSSQLTAANILDIENFQEGGYPVSSVYEPDLVLVPAAQSQYSTIPYEMDNLLVQIAVGRILDMIGDTEGLRVNDTRVKALYDSVTSALGNRIRGESKKIVNRRSIIRDLKRRFRRNW